MKSPHKICVVGSGYWGKNHISTLYKLGSLAGIVDVNSEVLRSLEAQYPDVLTYQNIDDAIQNDEFAGFTIATPAETHYEIAKKIIEAKKPVLVEKPLSLTIDHAESLVKLAINNSVNLMVGHILLFHPAIRKIKKLINEGKIGKLQYIYSNRLNLGKIRKEENVFWSLAPHDLAIFQYFTKSFPTEIYAHGSMFLQKGIHDSTITTVKYPTGVEGHIFVSWLHPFKEHRLVIIGSDAMITFEDSSAGKPLKLYSKKFKLGNGTLEKLDGPVDVIEYEDKMPLTEEMSYFINHLGRKTPEIANGAHALEVTKILVKASKQLENYE